MADLAGFDVIGEIHLETVVDLINLVPVTNPSDGASIYLLGGPFSTDLPVKLGPLGNAIVRIVLDATLQGVVHQPLVRLAIAMKAGSTAIAGRSLSHIGGQISVSVPLTFALPPSAPTTAVQLPVLLLGAVAPVCVLDDTSRAQAEATLGTGGADALQNGICVAVGVFLATVGTTALPALGFKVLAGVDSNDPLVLSALPTVAWIDATTLGVFGYYRATATGGDVASKIAGDLDQRHEEFFYGQPGVTSVLPGRRSAVLMSTDAFHRVLTCPTVRNSVVRALVDARELFNWSTYTRTQHGAEITRQVTTDTFFRHYTDEATSNPAADAKTWYDRAMASVSADVEAAIAAATQVAEESWLDASLPAGPESAGGQQSITAAVPPPCGTGSVQIARRSIDVPIVQGDLVPMLDRLDIRLGGNRLTVDYGCNGSLEISTGDLWFSVNGSADVFIGVTYDGRLDVTYDVHPPTVEIGGSGFDGSLLYLVQGALTALFGDAPWSAIMAYLGVLLQSQLTKYIMDQYPRPILIGVPAAQDAFATRMVDVQIDPDSLIAVGLICRRPRWNEFHPGLLLDATIDRRVPAQQPSVPGKLHLPATPWGCPAADFDTVRTLWDTTVSVHARLRDAPLPVTIVGWQMELGNFSANSLGAGHYIDPRPTWSGEPVAIVAGSLTLPGVVNHPDAPLVLIQLPFVLGHLQRQDDVSVVVAGDSGSGWTLALRGIDGNFFVRFALDATDGDGVSWHAETFVAVQGDQLDLPRTYWRYKADCDARYAKWYQEWWALVGSKYATKARVQPGQPQTSDQGREAEVIRAMADAGDPAALRRIVGATERFGVEFLGRVGRVGGDNVKR